MVHWDRGAVVCMGRREGKKKRNGLECGSVRGAARREGEKEWIRVWGICMNLKSIQRLKIYKI